MVSTVMRNGKNSWFVLSVDGMLGKEAQVLLKQLSQIMVEKMEEPVSHMRGWIDRKVVIAVTRFYSHILCYASLPITLWCRKPKLDSGSGLLLAQWILQ